MAQAFGLTSVEAEIAIGVGSGKTLAEIADEHAMKVGTVRAYSKRVFSKTYTRGQPELAALVTRLTFVVPQARVESGRTARRNLLGGETADLRLDAPRYKRQSAQQGGVEQP
jgi:DNA-binding CsgD family transcriptional regulator